MARPFDVCIRGGGITGRALALLLARERLRVGLVVQAPRPHPPDAHVGAKADVRAYALNHKSRALLESMRCWPAAVDATPVLKMQVQGDEGGQVKFDCADTQSEALAWIVDVPVLEAQLAQATRFQPQIELLDQAQSATLTVVCEGKASASRDEFGVDFDVSPYAQHAIAARLQCLNPHRQTAFQWFEKDAILGVLPMGGSNLGVPGNSIAIVWSVEEARAKILMQQPADEFCRNLGLASHGFFGGLTLTSERMMWPLQLAQTRRWVGTTSDGRAWALAGDAAHTVHPLSGQGLNLGLADVAELASLLGGRDYWRSVADEKLLRRYERSRRAEAAVLAAGTDGLQRLFARGGSVWQTLRNAGMDGFERSGPLKNWVTRQAMGG
jgi:2-polyprenyl-6-methoxyphenol hydroxylase-like FAD-dependent oxidoreductase